MSNLTTTDVSEKRISLVYNSDITGFQPIDFSKIDGIESLLTSGAVTANMFGYDAGNAEYLKVGLYSVGAGPQARGAVEVVGIEGNPLPISGTVTANAVLPDELIELFDENSATKCVSIHIKDDSNNLLGTNVKPLPISGTVTVGNSVTVAGDINAVIKGIETSLGDSALQADGDGAAGAGVAIGHNSNSQFNVVSENNPLPIAGTVTTIQQKKSNISNFTVSGTNGTVLQANGNREELYIQNLSTSHLHVKYGASAAHNSCNFVLASSTNAGGGDGGSLSDLNYTGIVSVSGVSPNYICWERS
jgi:hypothetical protein